MSLSRTIRTQCRLLPAHQDWLISTPHAPIRSFRTVRRALSISRPSDGRNTTPSTATSAVVKHTTSMSSARTRLRPVTTGTSGPGRLPIFLLSTIRLSLSSRAVTWSSTSPRAMSTDGQAARRTSTASSLFSKARQQRATAEPLSPTATIPTLFRAPTARSSRLSSGRRTSPAR